MTYNQSIPLATDFISNSQAQLLTNFSQLNTQFGIDHIAFNTGTGNGDGSHKQLTFKTVTAVDPAQAGTTGAFYTKSVAGVAELFFANATTAAKQLTGTLSAASNGSAFLPGGIIMKWGPASADQTGAVHTFPVAFPNNCFSVVLTNGDSAYTGGLALSAYSVTSFTAKRMSGSGAIGIYYIAVGN